MPAKRRVRQLTILLALVALLATVPGPAAGTAGAQAAGAGLARSGQERGVAVTLLTGDKVLCASGPATARRSRSSRPGAVAPGRPSRSCPSVATST
jgi:hypothetical protein